MDSTVTAFITLTLVLQAAHVKAGKSVRDKTSLKNKKKFSALGKKGERSGVWRVKSVDDDGD